MSQLKRFLPSSMKEVVPYLSPSALEVIQWSTVFSQAKTLMKKSLLNRRSAQEDSDLKTLQRLGFLLTETKNSSSPTVASQVNTLSEVERKAIGDEVLRLYFSQVFLCQGFNLDLRPTRFVLEKGATQAKSVVFHPEHVYVQPSESFRVGLQELYRGFYKPDQQQFESGLYRLGLVEPDSNAEEVQQVKELLFQHFGTGDQSNVRFEIEHFRDSFHNLFLFLSSKNRKLPGDFLFLGLYLATLYLHLDQLGTHHDVRALFQKVVDADESS